jgi:tetratricopeptide (TPR) repeat protein
MTAAVPSEMNHPTDETLAAFTDTKLSPAERQEVIRHVAECAECRDVIVMTTEIKAVEAPAENVKPFPWKKVAPLAAAAAAVVAMFVAIPSLRERLWRGDAAMRAAAEIEDGFEKRQTAARLSLDDTYKPAISIVRGGKKTDPAIQILIAAGKAEEIAEKRTTAKNLHAAGLLYLLGGERDKAVEKLEGAAAAESSAAVLNDLAAAYLTRGHDDDYARALDYANRALQIERTPAGLWNRALALDRLTRNREAIAAWNEYLAADSSSQWAAEARDNLTKLQ